MESISSPVISRLRRELSRYSHRRYRINAQQFHKEKLADPWVLKTPIARKIAAQLFKEIRQLPKRQIFGICEALLESDLREGSFFAFDWAYRCKNQFEKSDFARFERWLKRYVTNWGLCDHLCGTSLGYLLHQYPELVARVENWVRSRQLYVRRAAAVILIYPVRQRKLLDAVFRVARQLLLDREDLVQKGYGWMLKEASNEFPDDVFKYIMNHRDRMPRTALRYALEKYPQAKRRQAMNRG